MIDVGRCVRLAMAEREVTSVALAKQMGVAYQQVGRWRQAETLKLSTIEQLADSLGYTLDEFLKL